MLKLKNFFVQCRCGEDFRIDELNQERTCSCGRIVKIAESVKQYLRREYNRPVEN
ncbi:MAG: hypothetical protein WC346_15880 [Methanogenium sp.]|jgi:hypothetical protein